MSTTMTINIHTSIDDSPVWGVLAPDGRVFGPMTRKTAKAFAGGLDSEPDDDGEGSCNHLVLLHKVAVKIAKAA